jgi:acylphosphatase
MNHFDITISGRVTGVGFRYSARYVAWNLGIKGFVKNIPGNKVYIEAEGTDEQLNDFLKWCREGPQHAKVENVTYIASALKDFDEFEIRH